MANPLTITIRAGILGLACLMSASSGCRTGSSPLGDEIVVETIDSDGERREIVCFADRRELSNRSIDENVFQQRVRVLVQKACFEGVVVHSLVGAADQNDSSVKQEHLNGSYYDDPVLRPFLDRGIPIEVRRVLANRKETVSRATLSRAGLVDHKEHQ